jgi:hypothetical protein
MKSSGFILCVGLVVVLCSACGPVQQAPFAPTTVCTSDEIMSRVVELATPLPGQPPFQADVYGDCDVKGSACDVPPTPGNPSIYAPDIVAAFNIAPVFFKNELCTLDKIYIVTDPQLQMSNPVAWGMRERLYNNRTHLGISAQVWTNQSMNQGPGPYTSYESWVLNTLLNNLWPQGPSYSAATPDRQDLRILGILAHEMGHVIWWIEDIIGKQCTVNGQLASFYSYTWHPINWKHGFHKFGDQQGNKSIENFDKDKILKDLSQGKLNDAGTKLQAIYGNENWVSLFAFVAPDEDFVETYKLYVLTQAQPLPDGTATALQHLTVQIPRPLPQSVDVISQDFNAPNSNALKKHMWIDALINGHCT